MRIVLTDKELNNSQFPEDVQVIRITRKGMCIYNNNKAVVAIAGSRAMATTANQMNFPCLRFFQLTSAGFDGVPLEEFRSKGVLVSNAGSTYSAPIAETVVLAMLLMAKRLHSNPNNRHFKLYRHYVEIKELYAKKVIILGVGSIGTEVAKRLSGFEMTVDGYAKSNRNNPYFNRILCSKERLLSVIADYDYVISTLPENENTKGFFDNELLNQMKQTAIVINVGRKSVFREEALFTALKNQMIGGAVLDMYERVPNPVTNKFRRLRNVIVLPGVSAISQEVNDRLKSLLTCNILLFLQGQTPGHIINAVIK